MTGILPLDFFIVYGSLAAIAAGVWFLIGRFAPPLTAAVFKRNLLSYFSNPIGYLFIVAFTLTGAYFAFWHNDKFFASNLCDLAQLSNYFPYVLLFFIPAVTMSVWAEERKSGTEELLLTLPGSDLHIVIGKYLAAVAIYTVALGFLGLLYFVLDWLGEPDGGLVLATFLGYWLIGASLIAAGMVASLLTSNITVAFILGAALCLILVAVQNLGSAFTSSPAARLIFDNSGIVRQFEPFTRGVISLGSVVYFVAVAIVMLYFNVVLLSRRHWQGGDQTAAHWTNYALRGVSLVVIAVGLTIAARSISSRYTLDATQERLHTLSDDTVEIINKVDPKRPVLIEAFISPNTPKDYEQTRRDLIDLLERFDALGGDNINVQIFDTELFSQAARDAEKVYGIRAQDVPTEEDSRQSVEKVFMGVAFKSGLNEKTIPFFWRALPVEYELARMVRSVSQAERTKVGVLTTDANLFGQFDFQMMRPSQDWMIINELKQQYEVVRVSPDSDVTDDIKVLIVPMASSLTDPQLDRLIAYIKSGRSALIFDDPMPVMNTALAARKPRQPQRNPMMGMQQPPSEPKGDLTRLTRLLNIEFDTGNVVWQDWNPVSQLEGLPKEFVFIGAGSGNAKAFNPAEPATSGLQQLVTFLPGSIIYKGGDGPTASPLLSTGNATGLTKWDEVLEENFLGMAQLNPRPKRRPTGDEYVLASYIRGKLASSEAVSASAEKKGSDNAEADKPQEPAEINVIFVGDLDVMSDEFFRLRQQATDESLRFDNVTFILNCVDTLASDQGFLELRKKRPKRRTLDRIESMILASKEDEQRQIEKAQEDADKELAAAQQKLNEEVQKIEKDESIPRYLRQQRLELARAYWQRNLDQQKDRVDRERDTEVQRIREDGTAQRRAEERRVKWLAVLLPPIPALLIGLVVFFVRLSGEREGVDPDRLVDSNRRELKQNG